MLRLLNVALRNLARNRRRTLLTIAALAVGVTGAVGVRGFLNGLQGSFILGVVEGGEGALQIHRTGFMRSLEAVPLSPAIDEDEALYAKLLAVEGVRAIAPRIPFAGMVNAGDESPFARIVGTDPARELEVSPRRKDLVASGRFLAGDGELLIGMELAKGLGTARGEKVAVITGDVDGVMNAIEGSVVGELAAATAGEKRLLLLSLDDAQRLLRMEGKVTEIAVRVDDIDDVDAVKGRVLAVLGPGYEVHTWMDLVPLVRDARAAQNAVLRIVIGVFLFIILMGVANTMLMNVLERVREIGTMMALGARRRQVMWLFVVEAALLGGAGASLGALLGTIVVTVLGRVGVRLTTPGSSLPQLIVPFMTLEFIVAMVLLGAVGAALAALWPAWRASRLHPALALTKV